MFKYLVTGQIISLKILNTYIKLKVGKTLHLSDKDLIYIAHVLKYLLPIIGK